MENHTKTLLEMSLGLLEQIDLTNDDDSSNDNDLQSVWRITLDVNSSNCPGDNGSETFHTLRSELALVGFLENRTKKSINSSCLF